jgi:RnfABCDGE-type electron transport complex B subunit
MNSVLLAPAILGGLSLFLGTVLALAYRLLRVPGDPRIEETEERLPGSNCGACGEPGCRAFAERLVAGELQPSRCTVANDVVVEAIAELLDVDTGQQEKRVARLHCAGGETQAHQIAEYRGFDSCAAAAVVSGGGKGCSWGCLGLADCEAVCTFEAIAMNANGLPVVDIDGCVACGDCVEACPRSLFEVLPLDHNLVVQCASPLAGGDATAICSVACDACGRCKVDAAPGLVRMRDNLAVVDYSAGGPARPNATRRCPTNAIVWLTGIQFSEGAEHRGRRGEVHARLQ